MSLYCGIDVHSNIHFICVIDEKGNRIFESKFDNDSGLTIKSLSKYKRRLKGIAVESTYNWYWLINALMDSRFHFDLVSTAKVVQYGALNATGYTANKTYLSEKNSDLRDLLRKQMHLVQTHNAAFVRFKSIIQLRSEKILSGNTARPGLWKGRGVTGIPTARWLHPFIPI